MDKRKQLPIWIIGTASSLIAILGAVVYFEHFQPWPEGHPPDISGKWHYTSNIGTDVEIAIVQNGETLEIIYPQERPASEETGTSIGCIKAPNRIEMLHRRETKGLGSGGSKMEGIFYRDKEGLLRAKGKFKMLTPTGVTQLDQGAWEALRIEHGKSAAK